MATRKRGSTLLAVPVTTGEDKGMAMFTEVKAGFEVIVSDRLWFFKMLLAGVLLINPLLLVAALNGNWVLAGWLTGINALTFWLPLGYTMEVLRRARNRSLERLGLPSWEARHWPTYAREGAVKFFIAFFTLILPSSVWIAGCVVLAGVLKQPILLGMAAPIVFFFTIPFCAVACCRWIDNRELLGAALDYRMNFEFYRFRWNEYSIATLLFMGLNAVGSTLVVSMPVATVFGLCLADTWFGPIYADTVRELREEAGAARQSRSEEALER